MLPKKRGVVPVFYKIIYDMKVVAVYKKKDETSHLKRLAALKGAYRSFATAEEYSTFIRGQRDLLGQIVTKPYRPEKSFYLP